MSESASSQTPGSSTNNFTAILNTASTEYHRVTGKRLDTHPFAALLDTCNTPDAVLNIFRTQAQDFSKFRKGDERLMAWLDPIIHILFVFSGTLGEGIGLVSPSVHRLCLFSNTLFSAILTRQTDLHRYRRSSRGESPCESIVAYSFDAQSSGREGCCSESQHIDQPLGAHSFLPPTSEQLHWDPSYKRIGGVTWDDYGADTFCPCTFDKGNDRKADQ